MKNLFTAIVLISIAGIVFTSYYLIKSLIKKRRHRIAQSRIQNKIYEDEKFYFRDYLRSALVDLESGTINWILIFSRLYPSNKVEITISPAYKEIQILNRSREFKTEEKKEILNFGINIYSRKDGMHVFLTPSNSKIITDIIYYLFEIIQNQKSAVNLKIVTSGG